MTRGQELQAEITALLRARNSLLWIVARDEKAAESCIFEAAAPAGYTPRVWDCATGLSGPDPVKNIMSGGANQTDALAILRWLDGKDGTRWTEDAPSKAVRPLLVLRDMHKWLGDPMVLRAVRSYARKFQTLELKDARVMVIIAPTAEVPPELAGHATVVEFPVPDRAEMARVLDDSISALPEDKRVAALAPEDREAAIDAALGLTAAEASNCYAKSIITTRGKVSPALVRGEKKRVISNVSGLQWIDPDPRGLDAIGGMGEVKAWVLARKGASTPEARAYGLPRSKGVFMVGVPGSGKTLFAKCVATVLNRPLLKADLGGTQSKYLGESQSNLRRMLKTAETVAPCVLYFDEIEKALSGAQGPAGDGGVAADQLGTFLSWLQDCKADVFVVATANDVRQLPPELLRKGRFDEVFWSDLPNVTERAEIVAAALAEYKREPMTLEQRMAVADACQDYTGSEIASIVPDAMFAAFADGARPIVVSDLVTAAAKVTPLVKTAAEKITVLREWAKGRARPASSPVKAEAVTRARQLDIDDN